jgi:hypothetical protein
VHTAVATPGVSVCLRAPTVRACVRALQVTRYTDESQIKDALEEGTYVRGLYLEGASWDLARSCLRRQDPKVLVIELPILQIGTRRSVRLRGWEWRGAGTFICLRSATELSCWPLLGTCSCWVGSWAGWGGAGSGCEPVPTPAGVCSSLLGVFTLPLSVCACAPTSVPIEASKLKLHNTFRTPCYVTQARRNAMGVGLVFEADLASSDHDSHWILQGVALCLNTDA